MRKSEAPILFINEETLSKSPLVEVALEKMLELESF
jgi:hypothetical protein